MRILVFGNSHSLSIKSAHETAPRDGVEIDFMYQRRGLLSGALGLEGTELVALATGPGAGETLSSFGFETAGRLDLAAYDRVVLASVGLAAPRTEDRARLANDWRLAGLAEADRDGPPLLSREVYGAALRAALLRSPLFDWIDKVAACLPGDMVVMPYPLPGPRVLEPEESRLADFYGAAAPAFLGWYFGTTYDCIAKRVAAGPDNLSFLDAAPPDWLESGVAPENHSGSDPWHLNEKFGNLVLDRLLADRA